MESNWDYTDVCSTVYLITLDLIRYLMLIKGFKHDGQLSIACNWSAQSTQNDRICFCSVHIHNVQGSFLCSRRIWRWACNIISMCVVASETGHKVEFFPCEHKFFHLKYSFDPALIWLAGQVEVYLLKNLEPTRKKKKNFCWIKFSCYPPFPPLWFSCACACLKVFCKILKITWFPHKNMQFNGCQVYEQNEDLGLKWKHSGLKCCTVLLLPKLSCSLSLLFILFKSLFYVNNQEQHYECFPKLCIGHTVTARPLPGPSKI